MDKSKNGILLETGTNEIEIMEFTIDGNLYGINVAKVRRSWYPRRCGPCPIPIPLWRGSSSRGTR